MSNPIALPRNILVFVLIVPLAAILGYMLTSPDDLKTWVVVGMVLGALSIPIFLKWHRPLLLLSWNSAMIVFFLPGQPQAWMLLAMLSLGVIILESLLNKEQKRINVPALTWPLLVFAVVVLVTAKMTGGLGVRSMGGNVYGGKKYYYILFGILAYFALSLQRIPRQKAQLYVSLFLLGGLALAFSNVIYLLGQDFWFLYGFFSSDFAVSQALEDLQQVHTVFGRLNGVTWSCLAAFSFMLMRFGIRGIFDFGKPWRLAAFIGIIVLSLLGGFRSVLVIFFLMFSVQYYLEGLLRTRLTLTLGVLTVIGAVFLAAFATRLPMSIQRSISFLPVEVNPVARWDAQASNEWRLRMWSLLWPEVPKYLWKGKGYTASPTDYYLAVESTKRGLAEDIELALISGDYHNGPLSVIIPFGIWGMISFVFFLGASIFVLHRNYKYGPPELRNINVFLYSAFVARALFYMTFFGAINSDMAFFAGLVGLSVAINGGMAKVPQPEFESARIDSLPEGGLLRSALQHRQST